MSLRIALGVATLGRADTIRNVLPHWRDQSVAPDRILYSAVTPEDLDMAGIAAAGGETLFGPKGLCAQRNRVLDHLAGDCDIVAFVDDDYVPSRRFIENVREVFEAVPDAASVTGLVIDDGVKRGGISYADAAAMVAAHDAAPHAGGALQPARHAYGCNMILRVAAAPHLRFDERLPLYGWQEDLDFSRRIGAFGRILYAPCVAGVHMGVTAGRQSGVRLGYSQVANPIYLVGKRTMPLKEAATMIGRNIIANTVKSLAPEPWIDRRGRLYGNLLAFADALRARQRPERILEL